MKASAPPYLPSPRIGVPIAARWARSWWVRPVSGISVTSAAFWPAASITANRVTARWPSSASPTIFSRPRPPALPSARSILPRRGRGTPHGDGEIDLAGLAVAERGGERLGGGAVTRDHEHAARYRGRGGGRGAAARRRRSAARPAWRRGDGACRCRPGRQARRACRARSCRRRGRARGPAGRAHRLPSPVPERVSGPAAFSASLSGACACGGTRISCPTASLTPAFAR